MVIFLNVANAAKTKSICEGAIDCDALPRMAEKMPSNAKVYDPEWHRITFVYAVTIHAIQAIKQFECVCDIRANNLIGVCVEEFHKNQVPGFFALPCAPR